MMRHEVMRVFQLDRDPEFPRAVLRAILAD